MKRRRVTSQRVIAAAVVVIALALVWQTVRQELGWWGHAGWFGYAPLGATSDETVTELTELWTVNGAGREPKSIDLVAGVWTIELIQPMQSEDVTQRVRVGLNWARGGMGWVSDNPKIVCVGSGCEEAEPHLPAGPVELSVDTHGSWMVLLEPVFCPRGNGHGACSTRWVTSCSGFSPTVARFAARAVPRPIQRSIPTAGSRVDPVACGFAPEKTLSERSVCLSDRLNRRETDVHRFSRASFQIAVYPAASHVRSSMVGAGVILGQVAFGYFAATNRISAYRADSDYDNLDLYRMLEVVDGPEGWKLLHSSDRDRSTVSYKNALRDDTDQDVLVYESQTRPTLLDAEGFAVTTLLGSGRVVSAGGELVTTDVERIPNELANQIADFKVLGP